MLNIAQEKKIQSIQSEEIIWSGLGFYIVQFNVIEKCQSALVENFAFKNQTLKVVLWGHRGGVLRCSTEAQDKGRFTYVQCKFTCSESLFKFTAPTLRKFHWGPVLHLLPLHSAGPGDSSIQEHWVQRGVNWMKPYAEGWMRKKFWFKKKSANNFLLICLAVSLGSLGGSQTTVPPVELGRWLLSICPTVPCVAPHPGRGKVSGAEDTCLGTRRARELLQEASLTHQIQDFISLCLWIS